MAGDLTPGSFRSTIAAAMSTGATELGEHWNTRKFKEEYDNAMNRLCDPKFNISKLYPQQYSVS